jgi:predicted ATP-grasp superfamily ATP-dependent carboligase
VDGPQHGLDDFVGAVNDAVESGAYEIVFPSCDRDLLALSVVRDRVLANVPLPPHERVLRALDKAELTVAAERVGFRVPSTSPAVEDALAGFRGDAMVVKERLHGEGVVDGATHLTAVLSSDPGVLAAQVDRIRETGGKPLIQEALRGPLMALTVLADREARVRARVQQVAERTWPRDTGSSVRAHTVPVDVRLATHAEALIAELGWFGIAELQFVVPPGGEPHLIDFNGRFYGSLWLAIAAGVNLPALWATIALGRDPGPLRDALPGVRFHWLQGELERAREDHSRSVRELASSARYAFRARHGIWSVRDPRPALAVASVLARRAAHRARRGATR